MKAARCDLWEEEAISAAEQVERQTIQFQEPGIQTQEQSNIKTVKNTWSAITEPMVGADKDIDYTDYGNPKKHPKVPHTHPWIWNNGKKERKKEI